MKCPKCNNEISESSQYCKVCGQKIDDNHDNQYYYSEFYSNIYRPTITSDEDYIKTYIGPTYETVKKEAFYILAFILGPFYLLIKKIYAPAFLFILLIIGIYLYDQDISYIFYIIVSVYIGFKGNSMYIQHATRKVEEIKIGNPDKSSTELLEICKQSGKPNQLIIITLVFSLIFINSVYLLYKSEENTNTSIQNGQEEITETVSYTTKNMRYELYPNFTTTAMTYNYTKYEYKDDNNYCHITILVDRYSPIYKSIDEYIENNVYIEQNYNSIADIGKYINGQKFKIKRIESNNTNRLLLFTLNNNNIYNIEYSQNNNYKNTYCEKTIEKFIDTIYFEQEKEQ